ncbi:MAG: hypothetical protein GY854_21055 [Deltaproteobacteria bacterium]|nr:hypothetical protein [Deltaproteobacteria bacterium]
MAERVKWIVHKGKKILSCDFSNVAVEKEYLQLLERTTEMLEVELNGNPSEILQVVDITGAKPTRAVKEKAKDNMKLVKERSHLTFALVGISGLTKIIANAISKDMYFVSNIQEAKDKLVNA